MAATSDAANGPRTVLELKIRERRQTFEEFAEYAEAFAREHNEPGTLSVRHLQRLAAGQRGPGRPLGPVRPTTARLLERIFGLPVADLLTVPPPAQVDSEDEHGSELRQRLNAARRIDAATLGLFAEQLDSIRRLDRQLGAAAAYREATAKAEQMAPLMAHSLSPATRTRLAVLLVDAWTLAGWAALDLGHLARSWEHHEHAKAAAREADSTPLLAYAIAQQAVILIDVGDTASAARQLASARSLVDNASGPPVLWSWLAAAHGEGLAAAGHRDDALRAFDTADALLPTDPAGVPFVFLGDAHLARWRGHALATLGHREASAVLATALNGLDPSFTRAEVGLRTDLATALAAQGEDDEARLHLRHAWYMATDVGSIRHKNRLRKLSLRMGVEVGTDQ